MNGEIKLPPNCQENTYFKEHKRYNKDMGQSGINDKRKERYIL